jgi:hypothetical protein
MLKNYKVYFNYLMCRLGFRDTLPRDIIKNVQVEESNEPLVNISKDNNLFFIEELKKPVYLREKVYIKLRQAYSFLPQGYYFKIHDAYRDIGKQKESWIIESMKQDNCIQILVKKKFKGLPD